MQRDLVIKWQTWKKIATDPSTIRSLLYLHTLDISQIIYILKNSFQ